MDACTKKILLYLLSGTVFYVCFPMTLMYVVFLLLHFQIHQVEADYLLGIRIHNYSNPTNQCPTCPVERGHCCDTMWPNGTCVECNTYFYYCLHDLNDLGECTDGRISYESEKPTNISEEDCCLNSPIHIYTGEQQNHGL